MMYRRLERARVGFGGEAGGERDDALGAEAEQGSIKAVMTGSASDPIDWQAHIRNKARRETLAIRFRDPTDKLRIVLVRDMWLTGFDAPSLSTLYIDKPMRGHGLMQAIARVNRVFKDKPGGLVVDYLGLAQELKEALVTYTESGGTGRTAPARPRSRSRPAPRSRRRRPPLRPCPPPRGPAGTGSRR